MNLRASAIVMKSLPATAWGDALLISREEAKRIGCELEQAQERIEALERAGGKNMSKHTPGPWIHEGEGDITGIENNPAIGCVGKVDVACVYLRTVSGKTEANARLIAAAPELLEALKDALSLIETLTPLDGDTCRKSRKAIAKAESAQCEEKENKQ